MSLARDAAKRMLSRLGYRLVRVATPPAPRIDPPAALEHFPRGRLGTAWRFAEAEGAWLGALRALYADPVSCPASISPEAGWLLHWLARNVQARTIIEVGTCLGASTLWLAGALAAGGDHGIIHSVDDFRAPRDPRLANHPEFEDRQRKVASRVERAGLAEFVRLHKGNSKVVIPRLHDELRRGGGVQLAFIDGDHSDEGVLGDLEVIEPALSVGGYVVLHDTFPEISGETGPRRLIDGLGEDRPGTYQSCDLCIAPVNFGLAVLRRVR